MKHRQRVLLDVDHWKVVAARVMFTTSSHAFFGMLGIWKEMDADGEIRAPVSRAEDFGTYATGKRFFEKSH